MHILLESLHVISARRHPSYCQSDYVKEFETDTEVALKLTASVDSPQIKEIYKSLSSQTASVIIDNNRKNIAIPALEHYVAQLIQQKSLAKTSTTTAALLPGQIRFFDAKRTPQELFESTHGCLAFLDM